MWSGYVTIALIILLVLGFLIGVVKLGVQENEYKRKYGDWK